MPKIGTPTFNLPRTILADATRSATTQSDDFINRHGQALVIIFDVSSVAGGGQTVTLSVQVKDPVSGNYVTILTGSAQTASGTYLYNVGPGVTDSGGVADAVNDVDVGGTYRIVVTHSGGGDFDYSVGAYEVV